MEELLHVCYIVDQKRKENKKNSVLASTFWQLIKTIRGGCRGRDRMVVGFTTTNAISTYHH
jgi:hypothetical protein